MLRRLSAFVLTATLGLAPAAQAFGTLPGFKGSTGEHERITRRALACAAGAPTDDCFDPASISMLAGQFSEGRWAWGGVGAPDRRYSVFESHPHCDNGDRVDLAGYPSINALRVSAEEELTDCRALALENLNRAVEAARGIVDAQGRIRAWAVSRPCSVLVTLPGRSKCDAIRLFGMTLHATQDFYSHSNWTDQVLLPAEISALNPQGLGQTLPNDWMSLETPGGQPTSNLFTGCYFIIDETGRCVFGGADKSEQPRVTHEILNKDTGAIPIHRSEVVGAGTTPRGAINGNFQRAVNVAVLDTEQKWDLLQKLILEAEPEHGPTIICALRTDLPVVSCAGA